MGQSPSWEANRSSASQETPRTLSKPKFHERSRNCPPSAPINTVHYPHPTSWRSILILPIHPSPGLPSGSFPQVSPLKPCMHLSSPPYMLFALAISVFLIWSSECYLVKTEHRAACYVVFSSPCYLVRIKPKYPLQHQILEHSQS